MKDEREWYYMLQAYYRNKVTEKMISNNGIPIGLNPLYVGFKVTEKCNQNCIHCWSGKSKIDYSLDDIKKAMNKVSLFKPLNFTITGGEPFIREDIIEIISSATYLFPMIEIFTNGYLLDLDRIMIIKKLLRENDFVQISLDGLKKNYEIQRGAQHFDKVIENISLLVENDINVRLHMTVTKYNIDDIIEVYELAKQLGVHTFSIHYVAPIRKGEKVWEEECLIMYEKYIDIINKKHSNKIPMVLRSFKPLEIQSKYAKEKNNFINREALVFNNEILHWTINAEGDIFNFIDHNKFEELAIGNIYNDDVERLDCNNNRVQKILTIRELSGTKCFKCSLLTQCQGGEYIENYPNINVPDKKCKFELMSKR